MMVYIEDVQKEREKSDNTSKYCKAIFSAVYRLWYVGLHTNSYDLAN